MGQHSGPNKHAQATEKAEYVRRGRPRNEQDASATNHNDLKLVGAISMTLPQTSLSSNPREPNPPSRFLRLLETPFRETPTAIAMALKGSLFSASTWKDDNRVLHHGAGAAASQITGALGRSRRSVVAAGMQPPQALMQMRPGSGRISIHAKCIKQHVSKHLAVPWRHPNGGRKPPGAQGDLGLLRPGYIASRVRWAPGLPSSKGGGGGEAEKAVEPLPAGMSGPILGAWSRCNFGGRRRTLT